MALPLMFMTAATDGLACLLNNATIANNMVVMGHTKYADKIENLFTWMFVGLTAIFRYFDLLV